MTGGRPWGPEAQAGTDSPGRETPARVLVQVGKHAICRWRPGPRRSVRVARGRTPLVNMLPLRAPGRALWRIVGSRRVQGPVGITLTFELRVHGGAPRWRRGRLGVVVLAARSLEGRIPGAAPHALFVPLRQGAEVVLIGHRLAPTRRWVGRIIPLSGAIAWIR
jgi:hypothetical protein